MMNDLRKNQMPKEKRSSTPYIGVDFPESSSGWNFQRMWESGWFDQYDEDHFLLRAIRGDDDIYLNIRNYCDYVTGLGSVKSGFAHNFCINFITKMQRMIQLFGEKKIGEFVKDQLAAGKKHYKENAFFEALSEIEVLLFFGTFGPGTPRAEYEPRIGTGNCNPEASFYYPTGHTIHVEMKTPEFNRTFHNTDVYMPLRLLNEEGRKEFEKQCKQFGCVYIPPRVSKLKSFLESACKKFHVPAEKEYNILCINWSYTDVMLEGYIEPAMLLYNEKNGILRYKDIAAKAGISEEIYTKISAIFVFQNSVEAIEMMDLRYLWAGNPRKAVLLLNPGIFDTEEKKNEFYQIIQIRRNDFKMDFELPLYFDAQRGARVVVVSKLKDIIEKHML